MKDIRNAVSDPHIRSQELSAIEGSIINSDHDSIARIMTNNIMGKFSFLAEQLPGMSVRHLNGIQYIDSGKQSDTFNTVFGTPSSHQDIQEITRYYRQNNRPAAWWFADLPAEYHKTLQEAGWVHEENDTGMYLSLTEGLAATESVSAEVLSRIEYCDNLTRFRDFGQVLSAIFEPGNLPEAENIRTIYQLAGEHSAALPDNLIQLVGYHDNQPVSTATVYLQDKVAGIFDIATPESWRRRGFGSAMFHKALQVAQQQGAHTCVLQASPDGLHIYQKAGFTQAGHFEVWNLANHL